MPSGIAGEVTRSNSAVVEAGLLDSTTPPTAYGTVVKLVAGKLQPVAAADVIATVAYGIIVRTFPSSGSVATQGLGQGAPISSGVVGSILRSGYVNVLMARGTAAKGAAVFVRKTADTGKLVGDFEDLTDSGKCEALPGAFYMGPADANGMVEISYNI
jgi:hypothetical protein